MHPNQVVNHLQQGRGPTYIGDAFDRRTLFEMELAVSKACETLPALLDNYGSRRLVGARIVQRVESGERTFGGMVTAGLAVVAELRGQLRETDSQARAPTRTDHHGKERDDQNASRPARTAKQ